MDLVQGVVTAICLIVLLCTLPRIVRLPFLRHLISHFRMAGIDDPKPLQRLSHRADSHILLIGKTGHGKSTTGNSIVGRRAFKTSTASISETKEVKEAWAVCGSNVIQVVDGPGLEDTNLDAVQNKVQACENMAKALILCNGGVHAFVLVLKFGDRFTKEERGIISDLKQIFGESYLQERGIVVITRGEQFADQMENDETPGKTFTEWCRENDAGFENLFKECSCRVVMFCNTSKCEEEKTKQRTELLDHVKQLEQTQGLYTSEHFQKYAEVRKKLVKDSQQKILEETLQKRIDLLSAELGQLSINSSERDIDELDARIKDVYTEIGEEGKQQESMKQLIASLDRLRRASKEIRTSIRENDRRRMQSQLVEISQIRGLIDDIRLSVWRVALSCICVLVGVFFAELGIAAAGCAFTGVGLVAGAVGLAMGLASFAYTFLG